MYGSARDMYMKYSKTDRDKIIKRFVTLMEDFHGHPRVVELMLHALEIHNKKNHDYAKDQDPLSNLRMAKELGLPPYMGSLLRFGDKWSRICEIVKKKKTLVKEETLEDTLLDAVNYAIFAIILFEEEG